MERRSFENLTREEINLIVYYLKKAFYEYEKLLDEDHIGCQLGDVERGIIQKNKDDIDRLLIKVGA